jgi:hypothetical protein
MEARFASSGIYSVVFLMCSVGDNRGLCKYSRFFLRYWPNTYGEEYALGVELWQTHHHADSCAMF